MKYAVLLAVALFLLIPGAAFAESVGGSLINYRCDGAREDLRRIAAFDNAVTLAATESYGQLFEMERDTYVKQVRFAAWLTDAGSQNYTYQIWTTDAGIPDTLLWESDPIANNLFPNLLGQYEDQLAEGSYILGNPAQWRGVNVTDTVQLEGDTRYAFVIHTEDAASPLEIPRVTRVLDVNYPLSYVDNGTGCEWYSVYFDGADWFVDPFLDFGVAVYGSTVETDGPVVSTKQTLTQLRAGDDLGHAVFVGVIMFFTFVGFAMVPKMPPIVPLAFIALELVLAVWTEFIGPEVLVGLVMLGGILIVFAIFLGSRNSGPQEA